MTNQDDYLSRQIDSQKKYKNHVEKESRRKKLKGINKNFKRNQQSKRTRRRDWVSETAEDWDDLDYETEERVMPRNENERRRRVEKNVLQTEPDAEETASPLPEETGLAGRVVAVSKGVSQVEIDSRIVTCHIRGTLKATESSATHAVAVGDNVLIREDGLGGGVIEVVLPRRTVLARPDVHHRHRQQVIVANADQLLVVSAWREPMLWLELIDRYLIAAERNHLPALICINKQDLLELEDEVECQATLQPYHDLGYPVLLTSALTGAGIAELRAALHGKMTVLSGLSGVGKSSLLRAVQPDLDLRVGAVSDSSGEGRHTTTQAGLLRLDAETAVIDTPGIREFGLSGLQRRELAAFFPEMVAAATACRFADCTHHTEPDCGVQAAVEAGQIAASRYHSYRQIYETLPL